MFVIGKGTDPNLNNDVTIAFDKSILINLEANRPAGGYPPEQETAIQEMRDRINSYESEHGVVDVQKVKDEQESDQATKLAMLTGLTKSLGIK